MTRDRYLQPVEFKFVSGSDAAVGTFEGYGATFGNVDSYGDTIARGAFKATLKAWRALKKWPPMLLQHAGGWFGQAQDLVPIGVWDEMAEDDSGLAVKGHLLALDTDRGKGVYAAMREGALDGLSIGYVATDVKYGTKPEEPARTLKGVELVEVSIVTFPANTEARVEAVKAGTSMTEREFERFLRDAGWSREEAKTIVSRGYRDWRREAADRDAMTGIVASLKAGAAILAEGVAHGTHGSQGGR